MGWKDRLLKGSFRGVQFILASAEADVGRRHAVHEYPFRDIPYPEDMGRKKREYPLECYVIGDDAFQQRDKLLDACEQEGPGTLIHPSMGIKQVVVTACSSREVMSEGRIVRFSIIFLESGDSTYPNETIDNEATINSSAASVVSSAEDAFVSTYDVVGPDFLAESATDTVTSSYTMLKDVVSGIPPQFELTQVTEFLNEIDEAIDAIADVVSIPAAFSNSIVSIFTKISSLIPLESTSDGASILRPVLNSLATVNTAVELTRFGESSDISVNTAPSIYGGTLDAISETTASRVQERKNTDALVMLIREISISEAAKAAIIVEYPSYDKAAETSDLVAEKINEQLIEIGDSDIGDDTTFEALEDLAAKVVSGLEDVGADLSKIVAYSVPPVVVSSLALAYSLYEDVEREQEILDRNISIQHPGFLPGGTELEVLNA